MPATGASHFLDRQFLDLKGGRLPDVEPNFEISQVALGFEWHGDKAKICVASFGRLSDWQVLGAKLIASVNAIASLRESVEILSLQLVRKSI